MSQKDKMKEKEAELCHDNPCLDLNGEIVNHIQDNKVNNYLFNA
jgi:hypothetical protein